MMKSLMINLHYMNMGLKRTHSVQFRRNDEPWTKINFFEAQEQR